MRYGARTLLKTPLFALIADRNARARNRRQHRDLQRREQCSASSASLRAAGTTRAGVGDELQVGRRSQCRQSREFPRLDRTESLVQRDGGGCRRLNKAWARTRTAASAGDHWCRRSFSPCWVSRPFSAVGFADGDGKEGAEIKVILSYEFWQQQFGGDPNVVGTTHTKQRDGPRRLSE